MCECPTQTARNAATNDPAEKRWKEEEGETTLVVTFFFFVFVPSSPEEKREGELHGVPYKYNTDDGSHAQRTRALRHHKSVHALSETRSIDTYLE